MAQRAAGNSMDVYYENRTAQRLNGVLFSDEKGNQLAMQDSADDQWIFTFTFSFVIVISSMLLMLTLTILAIAICLFRNSKTKGSFRLLKGDEEDEDIELSQIFEHERLSETSSSNFSELKRASSMYSNVTCRHCGKIAIVEFQNDGYVHAPRSRLRRVRTVSGTRGKVTKSTTSGSLKAARASSAAGGDRVKKSHSYSTLLQSPKESMEENESANNSNN